MSITITLTKKNYIYPEQEKADIITNASRIPERKSKMIISEVKSDTNSFSIAINFLLKNKVSGTSYAYLDTKDNREISLKCNDTDTFDYYYIALNPNTIDSEHQVILNVDFN